MANIYLFVDIEYVYQVVYDLNVNELQQILVDVEQDKSGTLQELRKYVLFLLTDPTHKIANMKQNILRVFNTRARRNQQPQQPQQPTRQFLRKPQNVQIQSQSCTAPRPNHVQPIVETPIQTVQFENLPFFKVLQTLLKPVYCETNIDSAYLTGIFHLSENTRLAIDNSLNTATQKYRIQIILRLVQVGLNENVTERLPYNLTVSVNEHQCKLPTLNIPSIRGIDPWQDNVPIDITQQTVLKSSVQNTLKITWSQEQHNYMVGVYVARRLTWNDLLEELKKRPVRTSDKTKELIKRSMENDADMGIESMFATVKDPLTKLRMKFPARGVNCVHLQCFDAIQFLQMNEQKEKWICPLCKKKVKFENIEVDEFFLNMLQSPLLSEKCENVLLLKDGTWSEAKNREFSGNSRTNNCGSTNNIEVLTLSDDDNDADNSKSYVDNVDNDEIIPKPKRYKYNLSKAEESEHGIETEDLTNLSESDPTDEPINGGRSRPLLPLIESTSMSNNVVNLPNISISGSNNCVAGSSGSSRNNGHQEKDNSRKVLCVITLD